MSNKETVLQQNIRLALGQHSDLRLFRNETGKLPDPRTGRWVQFGLAKGSSDLIGFKTIKITPEMISKTWQSLQVSKLKQILDNSQNISIIGFKLLRRLEELQGLLVMWEMP